MRKAIDVGRKNFFGEFYMKQSEMNNYIVYKGVTDESKMIDSSVNFMLLLIKCRPIIIKK